MAMVGLAPMLGPVVGPIIGGYLGDALGWRWCFWLITILCGFLEICFLLLLRETYPVQILKRKANQLRKETGNTSLRTKYETEHTTAQLFQNACVRPLVLLFTSLILFLMSLYVGVVYGYLYLVMTTITSVFEDTYQFSSSVVGLSFLGLGEFQPGLPSSYRSQLTSSCRSRLCDWSLRMPFDPRSLGSAKIQNRGNEARAASTPCYLRRFHSPCRPVYVRLDGRGSRPIHGPDHRYRNTGSGSCIYYDPGAKLSGGCIRDILCKRDCGMRCVSQPRWNIHASGGTSIVPAARTGLGKLGARFYCSSLHTCSSSLDEVWRGLAIEGQAEVRSIRDKIF